MKGWAKSRSNIILDYIGVDVFRNLIGGGLSVTMRDPDWYHFRGGSIQYLAQTIESHMHKLLKKAYSAAKQRWKEGDSDFIEINADDIRLVYEMSDGRTYFGAKEEEGWDRCLVSAASKKKPYPCSYIPNRNRQDQRRGNPCRLERVDILSGYFAS